MHKEARKFRFKLLLHFDKLDKLFTGICATGAFAISITPPPTSVTTSLSSTCFSLSSESIEPAIDPALNDRNSPRSQSTTSCEITNISQQELKKRTEPTGSDIEDKGVPNRGSGVKREKAVHGQEKAVGTRVKKRRVTTCGGGLAIGGSLEYLADTSKSLSVTKSEKVIKISESEYSDLLSLNEHVIAAHLFIDVGKVSRMVTKQDRFHAMRTIDS